jgi:nucleoside-diphosphate-sugar epimerase
MSIGQRVFVTGASGFLGRALVRRLISSGASVAALSRSEASDVKLRELGAEPVRGDVRAPDTLRRGLEGAAVVYHAAARTEQWGPFYEFMRDTVEGTEHVLAAAAQAGVARFVHVSTEAVLAGGKPIVDADETWPYPPTFAGAYPRSKALAEQRALAANRAGFDVVVIRPRFIWGRGDTVLLPRLTAAMESKQWVWFGGGRYRTSTCNVANVCEGALLAAARGRGGEIYFLTDGEPANFRDFITALAATRGVDPGNRVAPMWLASGGAAACETLWSVARLSGEPPLTRTAVNLFFSEVTVRDAKARRELGYAGSLSVAEGLAELKTAAS